MVAFCIVVLLVSDFLKFLWNLGKIQNKLSTLNFLKFIFELEKFFPKGFIVILKINILKLALSYEYEQFH